MDDEITTKRRFTLESGICHSGTINTGLYTAFVWDNDWKSWLLFDDSKASKMSLSALVLKAWNSYKSTGLLRCFALTL